MESKSVERLIKMQERIVVDPQYVQLYREYRAQDAAFTAVMAQLQPEQREIIGDYLGLWAEMHARMLLIACA